MKKDVKSIKPEEELKHWRAKLAKYRKKYNRLRKESPDRWWHDEHFDIQLRVLENLIISAKEKIKELKRKPAG